MSVVVLVGFILEVFDGDRGLCPLFDDIAYRGKVELVMGGESSRHLGGLPEDFPEGTTSRALTSLRTC